MKILKVKYWEWGNFILNISKYSSDFPVNLAPQPTTPKPKMMYFCRRTKKRKGEWVMLSIFVKSGWSYNRETRVFPAPTLLDEALCGGYAQVLPLHITPKVQTVVASDPSLKCPCPLRQRNIQFLQEGQHPEEKTLRSLTGWIKVPYLHLYVVGSQRTHITTCLFM